MKLLLDENISYRVVALIAAAFPGSEQVRRLGLLGRQDRLIWDYARQHDFVIVTHDDDFAELSALRGAPPKVLLLRTGNQPTAALAALLLRQQATIEAELAPETETYCLTLH